MDCSVAPSERGTLSIEFVTSFVEAGVPAKAILRAMTVDAARLMGMEKERGAIAPGYAADIVVFDADTIDRLEERPVHDVPGDGIRYIRSTIGVEAVLVNGQVAWADGAYTDARSGAICG